MLCVHFGRVTRCVYILTGSHAVCTYWQDHMLCVHTDRVTCCVYILAGLHTVYSCMFRVCMLHIRVARSVFMLAPLYMLYIPVGRGTC